MQAFPSEFVLMNCGCFRGCKFGETPEKLLKSSLLFIQTSEFLMRKNVCQLKVGRETMCEAIELLQAIHLGNWTCNIMEMEQFCERFTATV